MQDDTNTTLSTRAANVLENAGITSEEDLAALSDRDIRKLKNCGAQTATQLIALRNSLTVGSDKLLAATDAWKVAVRRLSTKQGRVARMNARKDALAALKKMRVALDAHFPVISKKKKPRRKRKTNLEKIKALRARDYVEIESGPVLRDCISLKVRVHYADVGGRTVAFVPKWAVAASSKHEMQLAKRSRNMRESLLVHYMMGQRRGAK